MNDEEGAGVVGHNMAESGDAIGVEGKTESDEGYGLYTQNDAHVGGGLSSGAIRTEQAHITDTETNVINIPSDEETFSDAIDRAKEIYKARGTNVNVHFESGHVLKTSYGFRGDHYGYIRLTADDDPVEVAPDIDLHSPENEIIRVRNAHGPEIRARFDMSNVTAELATGIWCHFNGRVFVRGGGFINAPGMGATCRHGARLVARNYSDFHGSRGRACIDIREGSIAEMLNCDLSGGDEDGLLVTRCSVVHGGNIDASNCGRNAVTVEAGSAADINGSDLSGAKDHALFARRSASVEARSCNATNSSKEAIMARYSSSINASAVDASNSGGLGAIRAREGSTITVPSSIIHDANNRAIWAGQNGRIAAWNISVRDSASNGIEARYGGRVVVKESSIINSSGEDLVVREGGFISCADCETTNSSQGNPHNDDMNIIANTTQPEGWIMAENIES